MTALVDQLAKSLAARALRERLDAFAALLQTHDSPQFRDEQSEAMTRAVLAIWSGALRDLRPNVVTALASGRSRDRCRDPEGELMDESADAIRPFRLTAYIAAPFQLQDEAKLVAALLEVALIGCTSRWLTAPENLEDMWARRDLEDVASADVFIALNPKAWANQGTGGRHVELGYALALSKPIFLLGPKTNIFHHLREVACISCETLANEIYTRLGVTP